MILGFSDFLTDNAVIIILVLLGAILITVSYLKKNVLPKYNGENNDDDYQTPEEILQDEMDNLVVTEKYNPTAKVKKKENLYDDDDFDYDNVEEKKNENDDFVMNSDSGFSYSSFSEETKEK